MANPYGSNALQSLNRILQYREEKEGRKVQESLQFMELAQTKSYREAQLGLEEQRIEIAKDRQAFTAIQSQLDTAQKANIQYQTNIAESWITESGLGDVYTKIPSGSITDVKEIEEGIDTLTDALKGKKSSWYNPWSKGTKARFTEDQAEQIVTALWSFKQSNDPSSILSLAKSTSDSISRATTDPKASVYDKSLYESFFALGATQEFANMGKRAMTSLDNEQKILKEQGEFAQGDYIFQSKLNFGDDYDKANIQESQIFIGERALEDQLIDWQEQYEKDHPEDEEGLIGPKITTGALALGAAGIAAAGERERRLFTEGIDKYLSDFETNKLRKGTANPDALGWKEFQDKYKFPKKRAHWVRNQAKIQQQARAAGKASMSIPRAWEATKAGAVGAREWAVGVGGKAAVSTGVGLSLPFAGRAIGEAVGDQEGGMVGEAVGLGGFGAQQVWNQTAKKGSRSFISYLASKFPSIGGKAAAMAMSDSPMLPIGDIAALGFTAYEIYDLYQEWSAGAE